MHPSRPSVLLLTALLSGGCTEVALSVITYVDTFTQSPWEKVDVLLVVDNSCSMGPYQDKLSQDFGGFFEFFAQGEVDWRLAVAHTDINAFDFGRVRGPIVTSEAADPEAQFRDVVAVGTGGLGLETGLEAAKRVLVRQRDGFPRDDASISVIFVSDEQDASPLSVSEYVNDFFDIRGQRAREAFNASALTVTEPADCTAEQYQESSPGTRYVEVARLTGGIVANLCVDDFDQIVVDLALTTSAMLDTFYLGGRPELSTLEVTVDGEVVPCDAGQWRYDVVDREGTPTPALVFAADRLPGPGADVVAEYLRGSGQPEDFCPEAAP